MPSSCCERGVRADADAAFACLGREVVVVPALSLALAQALDARRNLTMALCSKYSDHNSHNKMLPVRSAFRSLVLARLLLVVLLFVLSLYITSRCHLIIRPSLLLSLSLLL